jgi:hypothetical protein
LTAEEEKKRRRDQSSRTYTIYQENRSVRTDLTDLTYHNLQRTTCGFHILPSISKGFRTYSRFTGKSVAENVEAALLEYMRNHPVQQTSINITADLRAAFPDFRTSLKQKLAKDDLPEP